MRKPQNLRISEDICNIETNKSIEGIDKMEYPAVDDVSFTLEEGRTIAIIGESGNGR